MIIMVIKLFLSVKWRLMVCFLWLCWGKRLSSSLPFLGIAFINWQFLGFLLKPKIFKSVQYLTILNDK